MPIFKPKTAKRFLRDQKGSISISIAFSIIPLVAAIGAAVDYGRSIIVASQVQSAVDQATLSIIGQSGTDADKRTMADAVFTASMLVAPVNSSLVKNADNSYTYSATRVMATMFVPYIAESVTITRSASASGNIAAVAGTAGVAGVSELRDDSCILSLGEDLEVSFDTLTFNGNPNVALTNCSLISNKSMKCNGNSVGAAASYAAGSIVNCPNPHPNQEAYPDIYASLSTNISTQCGTTKTGYTWNASGALPAANNTTVRSVSRTGYTELHICGNLTLSGTGSISGASPNTDTVVIIENGGLIMADNSNVTANRISFILSGNNTVNGTIVSGSSAIVTWPNGSGKTATLTLTPSTGSDNSAAAGVATDNPWRGMAIYQRSTINIDMDWKPGANLTVDGIVYFSRAKLTVSGNISYGAKACSKLVAGEFTLNGSVALKQDNTSCSAIGVTQYYRAPVSAVAATAGADAQIARLTR